MEICEVLICIIIIMKKILGQPGDFQVTPFLVPLHNHVLEAEE